MDYLRRSGWRSWYVFGIQLRDSPTVSVEYFDVCQEQREAKSGTAGHQQQRPDGFQITGKHIYFHLEQ